MEGHRALRETLSGRRSLRARGSSAKSGPTDSRTSSGALIAGSDRPLTIQFIAKLGTHDLAFIQLRRDSAVSCNPSSRAHPAHLGVQWPHPWVHDYSHPRFDVEGWSYDPRRLFRWRLNAPQPAQQRRGLRNRAHAGPGILRSRRQGPRQVAAQ